MLPSPTRHQLPLPASPSDSGFLPRREFATSNRPPNSFSLVTLTQASAVRLVAFPEDVVTSFRKFLEEKELMRLFRENRDEGVAEFVLGPRFWQNPKNIETELLLLEIMSFFNRQGYAFLSTIDYGRDSSDKLTLSFTRPQGIPSTVQQLVFAVSFNAPTSLRVLNPPLQSTPGILASVRTAWPRGVVSENKAGVSCYEFKLKGYSFFDEDTFQSDGLKHILNLLRSFDKYGFTLLTSLCLSNSRSRVKDLWVFSTPEVDSDTILPSSILTHGGGYTPGSAAKLPGSQTSLLRPPGHLRSTSEQPGNTTFSPSHTRNASVPPLNTTPKSGNTLLKKSPRPGADKLPPVSDNPPLNPPPSTLPYYGTVSKSTPPKPLAPPLRTNIPPQILYATPTPASETAGGPPPELFYSSSPLQPPPPLPRGPLYVANGGPDETDSIAAIAAPPPPLLSANAFRDTSIGECSQGEGEAIRESEFSTLSENSMDIPLAWTGGLPTTMEEEDPSSGRESAGLSYALTNRDTPSTPETNPEDRAFSPNPTVPGSWIDHESPKERLQARPAQQRTSLPAPQSISLPTKNEQNATTVRSPLVVGDNTPQKGRPVTGRDSADADLTRGWVLVNVTASPGFDSRRFDGGRSTTDPMPFIPGLPTLGAETPHSNGGPTAPPVAPKPKPKPRPPAHVQFSTSGIGGSGESGSEFGVLPTGGQRSAPLGGSVGSSYGARSGTVTGRPSGPERPPVLPPPMPVSKGTFKKMFTRSNSQRSQKRGHGFDDEKVNAARGVMTHEGPAPVSLVWKKGVNKSVSQLATYSAADLLGPPQILLPSPPPSLPMPSGSEPDLLELDLVSSPSSSSSPPPSSSSPPPSLSSNILAMSNLSPLQGGGLAAGTGHWVPGSTLATYPAPYHANASF